MNQVLNVATNVPCVLNELVDRFGFEPLLVEDLLKLETSGNTNEVLSTAERIWTNLQREARKKIPEKFLTNTVTCF